jgi:hypothetical protein
LHFESSGATQAVFITHRNEHTSWERWHTLQNIFVRAAPTDEIVDFDSAWPLLEQSCPDFAQLMERVQHTYRYCLCAGYGDSRLYVQCSVGRFCGRWIHPRCVAMTRSAQRLVSNGAPYICPMCDDKDEFAGASSAQQQQHDLCHPTSPPTWFEMMPTVFYSAALPTVLSFCCCFLQVGDMALAEPFSINKLEHALQFSDTQSDGLLADVHSKLLRGIGCLNANAHTWEGVLRRMTLASREWQLTWPPETTYKELSVEFRIDLLHCLCEEQVLSNPVLRELALQWAESERAGIQDIWSGPDSTGCYHVLIKDKLGTFRLYQRSTDGRVVILCTSFAEISRFTRRLIRHAVLEPQYTQNHIPRLYRDLFESISQLERLIDRCIEGVVNSLIDQVGCSGYKADRSLRLASSNNICCFCRTAIESTISSMIRVDGADEEVALVLTAVEDGEDTLVAASWLDGFDGDPPLVPLRSLSNFEIFDECYHLVNMEEGMLESGVRLYISGQVGALDQPSSARVCTSKLEVLVWEVIFYGDDTGREGDGSAGVAVCTDAAEYVLLTPTPVYSPFFVALKVLYILLCRCIQSH